MSSESEPQRTQPLPLKRRDTITRRLSRASTTIRRRASLTRASTTLNTSLTRASTTLNTGLNRASTSLTRALTMTSAAAKRLSLPALYTDTAPTSFYEAEFPSPHCFSPDSMAVLTEEIEDEEQAWGSPPIKFQAFQWPAPSFGRNKRKNTV